VKSILIICITTWCIATEYLVIQHLEFADRMEALRILSHMQNAPQLLVPQAELRTEPQDKF